MNYLTTLEEHLRLFSRSRNGANLSDAKFVRRYLELFLRDSGYENRRENQDDVGFASGAQLCHEREASATTNNFSLRKKNGPIKPEMLYMTFDRYQLN
jgi:hypothetical protein